MELRATWKCGLLFILFPELQSWLSVTLITYLEEVNMNAKCSPTSMLYFYLAIGPSTNFLHREITSFLYPLWNFIVHIGIFYGPSYGYVHPWPLILISSQLGCVFQLVIYFQFFCTIILWSSVSPIIFCKCLLPLNKIFLSCLLIIVCALHIIFSKDSIVI